MAAAAAATTTTLPFLSSYHCRHLKLSPRHPNPNSNFSSKSAIFASSSSPSSWEREEARWLREEQRWLREEQRWLREEARWRAERDALVAELAALRRRVQALELSPPPPPGRAALVGEADVKEMVLEEITVSEVKAAAPAMVEEEEKKAAVRRTLRMGAEGEDVRAMQEALERLGFYSGEEDMEFSSFSTGTDRAVKTWQSTQGTAEDGVMTSELLERLFMETSAGDVKPKDGVNGAVVASVTEIAEIQQTVVKESGDLEVEVSQQRVFLLGENRWEEPSRLAQKKPISNSAVSTTKCLSCRGEGRLMCTECDGTGEPNIEPQFLEWIDEGMKCPYCEGLGYTICDVCDGKTVVEN